LIELLIVLAVIGVLVGLALPSSVPSVHDQLRSTARILATDLAYGRSLAVSNSSTYKFTFDLPNNRYILRYSGSNPALRTLPNSPFSMPGDPADQHIVDLDNLPHLGAAVRLAAAAATGAAVQQVTDLEFGPLGATTRSSPTTVWLAAGRDSRTRYITVSVNPVTGLVDVGTVTSTGPPAGITGAPAPPSGPSEGSEIPVSR
jgi:Tfp pilus assembly protein FimT